MQLVNFIKIAVVCIFLMLQSPAVVTAQQIYPNTLTNSNYLDSANIKRYKKWIDTSRIHIELNRITGDIVIVLANQSVERSLLLTNFATNYKLHQPGYELQLIVEKECSVEIIGE